MSWRTVSMLIVAVGSASAVSCSKNTEEQSRGEGTNTVGTRPNTTPNHAELVLPQEGAVDVLVREEMKSAQADGRILVVYVGASWCEPCEYFLEAIHSDSPPPELAKFRFLKFDHDKDEARLQAAGYGGAMLPRFVRPGSEGRGGLVRFEGAIKGPGALGYLVPKLQTLANE